LGLTQYIVRAKRQNISTTCTLKSQFSYREHNNYDLSTISLIINNFEQHTILGAGLGEVSTTHFAVI